MTSHADWREVRSCAWLHEAVFLRSVLDAAGIEAVIPNEHTLSVQPLYGHLLGGVRLLVHPEDYERAADLLDSAESPSGKSAEDHRPD